MIRDRVFVKEGEVIFSHLQLMAEYRCPKFEGLGSSKCLKEEAGLEKLLAGSSMRLSGL